MSLHVRSSLGAQRIELRWRIVGRSGSVLVAVLLVGLFLVAMDRMAPAPVEEYRPMFTLYSETMRTTCGGMSGCGGGKYTPKKPTAPSASRLRLAPLGTLSEASLDIPGIEAEVSEVDMGEWQGFEVGQSSCGGGSSFGDAW